jgi:NIPSNAP/TAT (twin-arginine translocation) pathway signal sequence
MMERRTFLAGSMAATAATVTGNAQTQTGPVREIYQLRRYQLQSGPQLALANSFFADALIPALTKMGMGPVGAFQLTIGPETPAYYVLIPSSSAAGLAELDLALSRDKEFLKAASPFWNATATAPAFVRVESWLLAAFEGWPRLTPPAEKGKRIFQLRTYESPSYGDHVRKVEMFHSGEFEIFRNAGFHPVFFGDTLIGSRMPCLTYMLAFKDMSELEAKWDVFRNDQAWKKLSTSPRYASDQIVDNISNLILSPLECSGV